MAERESTATWGAIAVGTAITVPYVRMAIGAVGDALDPGRVPRETVREFLGLAAGQSPADGIGVASTLLALMLAFITTVVVLVIIGLIRRRQSAREAAFGVFGTLGLASGALGGSALFSTPRPAGAWFGVVTAVACAVVVGLLLTERAQLDFDRAELTRTRSPKSET